MGKWTPDYYDDVLHHKLKTIVSGSIKRATLERSETEPTITYEAFVEDLDTGDSFTSTVVDILVKELAERRKRLTTQESDKKLIAEKTAHSLKVLADSRQVFGRRRRLHMRNMVAEVAPSPPGPEDEDDFDEFLDVSGSGNMEGVQTNAVFDAFTEDSGWPSEWTSMMRPSSPDPLDMWEGGAEPVIPPPAGAQRLSNLHPRQSLTRQPSIRRSRPRAVDFNDFTSRRRSANRDIAIRDGLRGSSDLVVHRDSASPEPRTSMSTHRSNGGETSRNHPTTRRFFPLNRGTRRRPTSSDVNMLNEIDGELPTDAAWFVANLTPSSSSQSRPDSVEPDFPPGAIRAGRSSSPLHRLRRGGVRAPESMLSRNASPVPALPSPASLLDEQGSTDPSTSIPILERQPSER